jgi:hypothetical protein
VPLSKKYLPYNKSISLEEKSKEELQEKFELFLFNMSDQLEEFILKDKQEGHEFD